MHTGFCFAVLCCGYTLTDFPIFIRLTSLALWQSNDCPSASKATLMNMNKYFMWIHYERLHNHNKAKHNKTVCIFLRIYCIFTSRTSAGMVIFYMTWAFRTTGYTISVWIDYNDVIMTTIESQITSLTVVYHLFRPRSKETSKLRVTGLCVGNSPGPVNSPYKGPVTRKMFPFDDVIMISVWIDSNCAFVSNCGTVWLHSK